MTALAIDHPAPPVIGPGEIAGIIGAAVVGLGAIGKGIAWLFDAGNRRQRRLDDALQHQVATLTEGLARAERRIERLENEKEHVAKIARMLTAEVQRIHPASTILLQVEALWERAFPLPDEANPVLNALLDQLKESRR